MVRCWYEARGNFQQETVTLKFKTAKLLDSSKNLSGSLLILMNCTFFCLFVFLLIFLQSLSLIKLFVYRLPSVTSLSVSLWLVLRLYICDCEERENIKTQTKWRRSMKYKILEFKYFCWKTEKSLNCLFFPEEADFIFLFFIFSVLVDWNFQQNLKVNSHSIHQALCFYVWMGNI